MKTEGVRLAGMAASIILEHITKAASSYSLSSLVHSTWREQVPLEIYKDACIEVTKKILIWRSHLYMAPLLCGLLTVHIYKNLIGVYPINTQCHMIKERGTCKRQVKVAPMAESGWHL